MNRNIKLTLMFTPLILGFLGLGFIIDDLKHPQRSADKCQLVGRGRSLAGFKTDARVLYKVSEQPEYDIGLHCNTLGNVVVNDLAPLPIKQGEPIAMKIRNYHYLPTRYQIELPVINAEDPNEFPLEDTQ